jgi:lysophospholipase L1-like esterase
MLGDSITERVAWNELMGINGIANRGIEGDRTEGFLNRAEEIYEMQPELCFIMGGINDILHGISVEGITENYKEIIAELNIRGIKVIVQSTLYVSREWSEWKKINKTVDELNSRLKEICAENNLVYIDVNKALTSDGALDKEYTYDGLHLWASGYRKWKELIMPVMMSLSQN